MPVLPQDTQSLLSVYWVLAVGPSSGLRPEPWPYHLCLPKLWDRLTATLITCLSSQGQVLFEPLYELHRVSPRFQMRTLRQEEVK